MNSIKDNLAKIKQRISAAVLKSGREPATVRVVAVTKKVPLEKIKAAAECGQFVFGENFVQEARDKINSMSSDFGEKNTSWHYIGHLQSNKAKQAAELFQVIETIDLLKMARSLNNHLAGMDKKMSVLVQVNVGGESQKSGIIPDECKDFVRQLRQFEHLDVKGLMTMPPYFNDPEMARPHFKSLRRIADNLSDRGLLGQNSPVELSMGMSGDFEVAIEEGATLIRLGTAIFGTRD